MEWILDEDDVWLKKRITCHNTSSFRKQHYITIMQQNLETTIMYDTRNGNFGRFEACEFWNCRSWNIIFGIGELLIFHSKKILFLHLEEGMMWSINKEKFLSRFKIRHGREDIKSINYHCNISFKMKCSKNCIFLWVWSIRKLESFFCYKATF